LQDFGVPVDSSYAERKRYLQLVERMDANGHLKQGARKKIVTDLMAAMDHQTPYDE
jgi:hypothetical protein